MGRLVGYVPWSNPSLFYIILPFYIFYLFCHTKCTKKRNEKNALKNKSGQEALNRNHTAYTVRLLQLQPMMATHAEKSGKNL